MTMDIPSLQKALLNPEIYPDHPKEVGFIETHISLLFLTGNHVYKVKKPVNFGFLDFTSLEKRRYFCEQEVILNRRLAPDSISVSSRLLREGRISLEGRGEVVDYAVKMKQIPEELLMDKLLEKNKVTQKMMEAVSEKLVHFYVTAETGELIKGFGRPERIKQDTDENFEQTEKYIGVTISKDVYEEIKNRTKDFFRTKEKYFIRGSPLIEFEIATETFGWNISSGGTRSPSLTASNSMRGFVIRTSLPISPFWQWISITTTGRI